MRVYYSMTVFLTLTHLTISYKLPFSLKNDASARIHCTRSLNIQRPYPFHFSKSVNSCLWSSASANPASKLFEQSTSKRPYVSFSRLTIRCSWITWWIQIILSVISGVILTFANTVRTTGNPPSIWFSGFAFTGIGIILSFFNTFWTWNIQKLCRRVVSDKLQSSTIPATFHRYFSIAIGVSLLATAITLVGAEQIVGTLAAKALSLQGFQPFTPSPAATSNALQALDIFLVQANTNALVAQFAPTVCYSFLQSRMSREREREKDNDHKNHHENSKGGNNNEK